MREGELFMQDAVGRAAETAARIRAEIAEMRRDLKERQCALLKCERDLRRLEGELLDLAQGRLFDGRNGEAGA